MMRGVLRMAARAGLLGLIVVLGPWSLASASQAVADQAPADPGPEILPLDQVHRGQKGFGLSVFAGADPEPFAVEVLGVLRNMSPGASFILVRLAEQGLEESGVISGMSGSPVYLEGKLVGAVSFGWPFSQDSIAGVTPIEAMRELGGAGYGSRAALPEPPVDLAALAAGEVPADLLERELARLAAGGPGGRRPAVVWSGAGFGPVASHLLERSLGSFTAGGFAAAGASGSGTPGDGALEPGDAVAMVLVSGDLQLAATGTLTDRQGDQVLAFGHPITRLGPIRVPMAKAEVVTVVSSLANSFKVSNLGAVLGAFQEDRQSGALGTLGLEARTIPLTVRILGERDFHMQVADLPEFTPSLLASGVLGGLDTATRSGGSQGIDVTAVFHLAGHPDLVVDQSFDGPAAATEGSSYLLGVAAYLMQNDLEEVTLEAVDVEVAQSAEPRSATLVGAHAERTLVRPGERVTLNLDLVAYRGEPFRRSLDLVLPEDLPAGRYSLLVGDGPSVDAARLQVEPVVPVSFQQALGLLRSFHSRRDLVVLGLFGGQGLSVAGQALPRLPGTVRSLWGAAGSGGAVPLRLAVAQEHVERLETPLAGIVRVDLEVRRREPVTASGEEPAAGDEGEDATGPSGAAAEGAGEAVPRSSEGEGSGSSGAGRQGDDEGGAARPRGEGP